MGKMQVLTEAEMVFLVPSRQLQSTCLVGLLLNARSLGPQYLAVGIGSRFFL